MKENEIIQKETLHIYVRTSTENQDVKRQIELGKKFSKEMNMNSKVWNDWGKSGLKSYEDTREELSQLMFEVDLGCINHIWVEDYTRLTRLIDDQMKIDTLIMNNDLHIYEGLSGNKEYQPEDMVQRLFQTMKTMMGSETKKDEIKKSIDRKIEKFEKGYYIRGGVSFGFNKEGGKEGYLVPNKEESEWVRKIFDWYLNDTTMMEISKKLKVYGVKSKRGNDFSERSVHVLLKNIEYTRKTMYTDMTKDPNRKDPKKYPFPDESKWVVYMNDNLPRIVSDEKFNKVQKKLNRSGSKMKKHQYFLQGKVICKCGKHWGGRTKSRKDRGQPSEQYYMCQNTQRFFERNRIGREHLYKVNVCDKPKRLPTDKLDNMVWDYLIKTLRESHMIKERVKNDLLGGKYNTSSSRKKVNKDLKLLRDEIKGLERNRVQLIKEKYMMELSDVDFTSIDSSITEKITRLKSDLIKVITREDILNKRNEWVNWIGQHHKDVDDYMKITDIKQKRRVLDIYVNEIKVDYNKETQQHKVDIHFRFPLVKDGIDYTRDKNSKMKWDKWGNSYRIKKGNNVVSLSSLMGKSNLVGKLHSTVTDLAKLRG